MANYYLNSNGSLTTKKTNKKKNYILQDDGTLINQAEQERKVKEENSLFKSGDKDIISGLISTHNDILLDIGQGAFRTLEGISDTLQYGLSDLTGLVGMKDASKWLKENAKFNSTGSLFGTNENVEDNIFSKELRNDINESSYLGGIGDSIAEGVGNIGAMAALSAVGGQALGAVGVGVTETGALTTGGKFALSFGNSYMSAYGNARSEAYNNGASDEEARRYGFVNGLAEGLSEQFFDSMPGIKSVGVADKIGIKDFIANRINKSFLKSAGAKVFLRIAGGLEEGSEEMISNALVAVGQDIMHSLDNNYTYGMDKLTGNVVEDFKNNFLSEDSIKSFISAGATSVLLGGGGDILTAAQTNQVINAYAKDNNMTFKEAKTMFNTIAAEANKGSVQEQVQREVQRGHGEINNDIELEDAAKKRIVNYMKAHRGQNIESHIEDLVQEEAKKQGITYNQEQLKQEADKIRTELIDQTNNPERYQTFIQNKNETNNELAESFKKAKVNNTQQAHAMYNFVSKLQENNKNLKYQVVNNEILKEMGQDVEGATINGFNQDGTIYINMDAKNPYQAVAYHEIAHSIKDTSLELYNELKNLVFELKGKEGLEQYRKLYKVNDGELASDLTENVEDEYINDQLGEILNDDKFINKIDNRNIIQKLIDEIKRVVKYMTSSKDQKALIRTQQKLENIYKQGLSEATGSEGTNYSLKSLLKKNKNDRTFNISDDLRTEINNKTRDNLKDNQNVRYLNINNLKSTNGGYRSLEQVQRLVEDIKQNGISEPIEVITNENGDLEVYDGNHRLEIAKNLGIEQVPIMFVDNTDVANLNEESYNSIKEDIINNEYGSNESGIEGINTSNENIRNQQRNGNKNNNDNKNIKTSKRINGIYNEISDVNNRPSTIAENGQSNEELDNSSFNLPKFSLSQDSTGKELTKEQQDYFKDSKVRDENGNLQAVYHGTTKPGFTIFKPSTADSSTFGKYKFNDYDVNYFTASKDTARGYTDIGVEENGNIYETYLNITNPYVVDNVSTADVKSWRNIKDNNVRQYETEYYDKFESKWNTDKDITKNLDKINADLFPFGCELRLNDGYYELYRVAENDGWGEQLLLYVGENDNTNELFNEGLKEAVYGDSFDDYKYTSDGLVRWIIAQNADGQKYDGIIIPNITDNGTKGSIFGEPTTDYVTFNSNQIKNVDNTNPTSNPDIRYSLTDERINNLLLTNSDVYDMVDSRTLSENGLSVNDLISRGLDDIDKLETAWREANYENSSKDFHEVPIEEAVSTIRNNNAFWRLSEGWFRGADSAYKPNMEKVIIMNPELRNAGINIAYQNYKEYIDKDISFDDFVNKEIPLYRGSNDSGFVDADKFIAFSYRKDMVEKHFANRNKEVPISEIKVKIKDTLGSYQTTGEAEVLVPRNIVDENNVRFSLSQDSTGKELTKEQQEYFKDSEVRDNEGRLLEVYHGTPNPGFTIFDTNKSGQNTSSGEYGLYFTDSKDFADEFSYERLETDSMFFDQKGKKGEVYPVYLNAKNVLDFANLTEQEINDLYEYASNIGQLDGKEKFVENMLKWQQIGNHQLMKGNLDLKAIADNSNYDGIKAKLNVQGNENEYIVFNSNQIKNTDNTNPTENEDIRYSLSAEEKTNQAMTMEEAKDLVQRTFLLNDIKNWYDNKYANGDEWLAGEGIDEVEMYAENTELVQSKFLNKLYDKDNGFQDEYYISDILQAYLNGTLTGEVKEDIGRLDTSKDTGYQDNRFYSPQQIEVTQELYNTANQRVTNSNRDEVYKARADFIIAAHNEDLSQLGLSQDEINSKLKSWANYPKKALELSKQLNENVARQNQWTGLENSSIVNSISISNEEMGKFVKDIKGDSNNWQRQYITGTMLALDTHIDYSNVVFDFEQGKQLRENHAAGDYDNQTDVIRIGEGYQNTVAHEIGHYIDYTWGRQLFNRNDTLSSIAKSYSKENLTNEQIQFVEHFNEFQESIEKSGEQGDTLKYGSSRDARYWQKPTETFARFVGKFTEWVKNQATNNRYGYEEKFYKDNFNESQYKEFVKILQEKSALDTSGTLKYNSFNQNLIQAIDSLTDEQKEQITNIINNEENQPSYQVTDELINVMGKDNYYLIGKTRLNELVSNNFNSNYNYSLSNETEQQQEANNLLKVIESYDDYLKTLPSYQQLQERTSNLDYTDETHGILTKEDYKNKKIELFDKQIEKADNRMEEQAKRFARENLELNRKAREQLQTIIDKYKGQSREAIFNSTAKDEIREFVRNNSRQEFVEEIIDEQTRDLQKAIRNTELVISKENGGEFADGITQFKKNNPGLKIKYGKQNIDSVYQELQEQFPGMLDEDVSDKDIPFILADVLKKSYRQFDNSNVQVFELNDKEIDNIANKIYKGLTNNAISDEQLQNMVSEISNKVEEKYARGMAAEKYREIARNTIDVTDIKDKKRGIQYKINTMKRNLRDIMSKEQAQLWYDTYFKPITIHNAQSEIDKQSYVERIQKYNLNKYESTYTQMLGELKYNPETDLTSEQVNNYAAAHKIDTQKCTEAVEEFRTIYDELIGRINESLKANGYKPIDYRKGYFPHFIEDKPNSIIGKLADKFGWNVQKGTLPTDIAGITEGFKPGKTWTSFSQQRTGDTTDYNALKGMDNYLRGAMDLIYHTEDIQKLRALENEIRYQYSSEGVQKQIDEIYANQDLSPEEKAQQISILTDNQRDNPLGNLVTELRDYTNSLANKKSILDRGMEQALGRDWYSIMNNINGRVSANMVGMNISSAMTNFIPITQAWSQVSTKNLMRGMYESIRNTLKNDGFDQNSVYLTNRTQQADTLYKSTLDRVNQKLGILFEGVDSFTSNTIVRAKYYENLENGMNEQAAMENADEFAKDVMAGRSKGDSPTIFNTKNPLYKMFTAFQLEVNNQYGYMFKDIPADLGDEAKDKLAMAFMKMFIGAWLYNLFSEKITGRKAAFSPIDMIKDDYDVITSDMDFSKKVETLAKETSQEMPFIGGIMGGGRLPIQGAIPYENPLSMVLSTFEDMGKAFGDDEGKKKTAINNLKKEWSKPFFYLALPVAGGQIKKSVEGLSMYDKNLPIAGSYTSAGKLRFEADTSPLGVVQSAIFGQYASENAREYFDKGYTPLTEKQINEAMDANLPISEYRDINKGISDAKKEAKKSGNSQTEAQYDYIYNLPISDDQKNSLINSKLGTKSEVTDDNGYVKYTDGNKTYWYDSENDIVYNSKYRALPNIKVNELTKYSNVKDISNYGDYGSLAEFTYANENPTKYNVITQISNFDSYMQYKDDLAAIKERYDTTAERKSAVFNYINSLPLNQYQKLMLQKMGAGYSIKSYKGQMHNYLDSLDLTAEEKQQIDNELFS